MPSARPMNHIPDQGHSAQSKMPKPSVTNPSKSAHPQLGNFSRSAATIRKAPMTVKKDANSSVQARAPATGWVTTSRPITIPRTPPIRWRNIPPHARIRNVWISSTMPLNTRSHPSTITVPMVAAGVMKKAMVPRITMMIPSVSSHPHLCLRLSNSISSGLVLMCPPKADDCLCDQDVGTVGCLRIFRKRHHPQYSAHFTPLVQLRRKHAPSASLPHPIGWLCLLQFFVRLNPGSESTRRVGSSPSQRSWYDFRSMD